MTKEYDPRIAEARRIARQMAKARGTPYQAALEEVAVGAGAASWSAFVLSPATIDPVVSSTDLTPEQELARASDKKLLERLVVGILSTAVCIAFASSMLVLSAYVGDVQVALAAELGGTVFAVLGFFVMPAMTNGYLVGVRLRNAERHMPTFWRAYMAVTQVGVAAVMVWHFFMKA